VKNRNIKDDFGKNKGIWGERKREGRRIRRRGGGRRGRIRGIRG
jgi:hypothetical protein